MTWLEMVNLGFVGAAFVYAIFIERRLTKMEIRLGIVMGQYQLTEGELGKQL